METVLQLAPLPVPASASAPADLPCFKLFESTDTAAWLASHAQNVRVVITHSLVGVPEELWSRLPNLGLVANFGAGLERIDLNEAKRHNVRVTSTRDLLTDDVADLGIALTLCLLRGLPQGDALVRTGRWENEPCALGRSAKAQHLGILGLGRIGSALARRGTAFGMEIGYHSRHRNPHVAYQFFDHVKALALWADILVAALPGDPRTERLINGEILEALGPDGYFVNIARGSVVDEAALLRALESGRIAGAALDVFQNEPGIHHAFLTAPRTILSPHLGSATRETRMAMAQHVFSNARAFLSGLPLLDEIKGEE